jgi:kynurenine formamidase/mono/diheme cytochrome c family protein
MRWDLIRSTTLGTLFGILLQFQAFGVQARPDSVSTDAGVAIDAVAAKLFDNNCAVCHGHDGRGAVKIPNLPDFSQTAFQDSRSESLLLSSVANGRNSMPAFGDVLSQNQIRGLVRFVRHFRKPTGATPMPHTDGPDGLLERALKGQAHIYDLTHVISAKVPTYDGETGSYRYEKQAEIDKQGYTLGTLHIPEHFGTHVDAPGHFVKGKATIDQLDPSHFIAPAVVIDVRDKVRANPDYLLTPDAIEKWEQTGGRMPDGAAVLLLTGWEDKFADPAAYRNPDSRGTMHFPGYSASAVDYLLKHNKIVALGIDTLSIDYGPSKDFEAHKRSLGSGLYHLENLANLDKLPARGAVIFVGALPIEGGSGSPARVLALVP